jgi:hypothetical protein
MKKSFLKQVTYSFRVFANLTFDVAERENGHHAWSFSSDCVQVLVRLLFSEVGSVTLADSISNAERLCSVMFKNHVSCPMNKYSEIVNHTALSSQILIPRHIICGSRFILTL